MDNTNTTSNDSLNANRSFSITSNNSPLTKQNEILSYFSNLSKYISNLNINLISPAKYFELYIAISEKLIRTQEKILKISQTISLNQLYFIAYTDSRTLSRIYLLSMVGSLFPITEPNQDKSIVNQNEVCGKILQHLMFFLSKTTKQISGFFARFFVFNLFKDHFSKLSTNLSVTFLLSNLIEMNNTFVFIKKYSPNYQEDTKVLTCLIEKNINSLFSLKDMNSEIYRTHILASLISQVYNDYEQTYQEYIIDWIISGLYEEYLLISLEPLLTILIPLYHEIDPNIPKKVKKMLDRLLNYFKCNYDPKQLTEALNNRYRNIFEYLQTILDKSSTIIEIKQFTELVESYVHFTIYASPKEYKAKILNTIFNELGDYFSSYYNQNQNLPPEVILIYERICVYIFKSDIKIFQVESLVSFINYFDPESIIRSCCYILRGIVKNKSEINSSLKMNLVVELFKKILTHRSNSKEGNEQTIIIQIMALINHPNPEKQFEMFLMMKNIYDKKYSQLTKLSLPSFFNTLLQLIKKCEVAFLKQTNAIDKVIDSNNGLDMSTYDEEKFVDLLIIIYTFIKDSFTSTFLSFPETNLNFIPSVIQQIETSQVSRERFAEVCCSLIRTFISILIKEITDNTLKLKHMSELISLISRLTIIPKKLYEKVVYTITQAAKCFQKRNDTSILSILICDLYDNAILTDHSKIMESLELAKREAEFCLAKIENLNLFIVLLKKLLYFIDRGETFISCAFVNSVIDIINQNVEVLIKEYPEIGKKTEKDFALIKEHIDKMKEEKKIEMYKDITYKINLG